MPLALYYLLNEAANGLHRDALRSQAFTIASFLRPQPDGGLALDIPPEVRPLYSGEYGLYAYAVLDADGRVLFSSRNDGSAAVRARRAGACATGTSAAAAAARCIFGVSVARPIGEHMYFVQVGQDLAHRDVIIDDVVSQFFPRVAWITFPILLLLLLIDIFIFRRALDPVREASTGRGVDRPAAHRGAPARGGGADGDRAAGARRQPGVRPPRGGLPRPARLHGRHGARAAHAARHRAGAGRFARARAAARRSCAPTSST